MSIAVPLPSPSSWTRIPADRLFSRQKRQPSPDDNVVTAFRDGQVTSRANRRTEGFTNAIQEIGYQGVRPGDLVIHSMDGFAGAIGVSDSDGKMSPVVHVYTARGNVDARFFAYVLRTLAREGFVASLAKGIRERSTAFDSEAFASLALPTPPFGTQRAIADYLDRETARIDALIAAKRRLEALASGRIKSWLANQFDSYASQFGLIKIKYIVRDLKQGWSPQCEDRIPNEGEWSVLKAGAVNGGTFKPHERKALPTAETARPEYLIRPGDLLVNRANGSLDNLGSAAVVPDGVPERVLLCDKIFRASVIESHADARWLAAMLRAPQAREVLLLGVSGAEGMANSLPSSVILNTYVPKVDLEYQCRFVESWLRLEADARRMIDALETSVTLLQERREALITAAVTGQFDISAAA